ncbi:MAG: alkaline phosphatase family protein [Gammaproteobacteria bacterium]|nr:alkaline phosphatase family protein [Gammaproteobacteria bacterium]
MLRICLGILLSILFSALAYAETPSTHKVTRVIYITLDGTRWQDVFNDHRYFFKLKMRHANKGIFYGEPGSNLTIETASIPMSLPSYLSQMAGYVQSCDNNECGRIQVETVVESVAHRLGLNKKDVAVFSSWREIGLSAESVTGTAYTNVGNAPAYDPDTGQADAIMDLLNHRQAEHHSGNDRYDEYTFSQALHYLKKYQPRFLWISFNDADDAAHAMDLERYHKSLSYYDNAIDQLFTTLQKMGLDKETLVIVTTDHGRGNGIFWTSHGVLFPESKRTWAFVINGELTPISQEGNMKHYSTLSIRPTIEAALGII